MLRVALLSGWHVHAQGYAKEFNALPDSKITAVWDEDPKRGQELAEKYDVPFEPDYKKLLASDEIDAVCITAPTNIHREIIVAAANAKKHIFTEKVLATTNEDCALIKEAVEKNGVKLCISFPHRTKPQNLFAKKVVDEKIIGDITFLRVRNCHNGAIRNWLPPHFYNEEQCGGGALIDLGAHPMYLAHYLLGRPTEISSTFTNYTHHSVEDNAVAVLKYPTGAIAIVETGFVTEASPFVMEVYGTEGTLFIGGSTNDVQIFTKKLDCEYNGWIRPKTLPKELPSAIKQFVYGVLNDEPIHFTVDDGVNLTELMVAAYKSHKEGRSVAL